LARSSGSTIIVLNPDLDMERNRYRIRHLFAGIKACNFL
jgi:hypothetical protein